MNMSYCRFYNTNMDLTECEEYIEDSLSEGEHEARIKLVGHCRSILESLDITIDNDEFDRAILMLENFQEK